MLMFMNHTGIQIQMTLSGLDVEGPVIWGKPGAPAFKDFPVRQTNLVRWHRLHNMTLFQRHMMDVDRVSVASTMDQEELRETNSVVSVSSNGSSASALGGPIPETTPEGNIPILPESTPEGNRPAHVSLRSYPEMPIPQMSTSGFVRPSLRRFGHIGHEEEP